MAVIGNIGLGSSCQHNRTIIIDPNAVNDSDSDTNIFVPNEELSIIVDLETNKKNRSVLTVSDDSSQSGIKSTNNQTTISFIKGSITNSNGSTSLSTKYTDLTTVFNKSTNIDTESLGITNIDIDFSSSYAPLITINFIDVRGSSLFQQASDGNSPYNVLFELPYPIFQLTVKGYYGKAVKYCLHLTKFNSKFNSQTGNFEMTANFVGYTYALLSDMLIGYLRAITETSLGKKKFEERKKQNPNLLTINQLKTGAETINVGLTRLKSEDIMVKEQSNITNVLSALDFIENDINVSIIKNLVKQNSPFNDDNLIFKNNTNSEVEDDQQINNIFTEIKTKVTDFNKIVADSGLDEKDFNLDFIKYKNITYSGLTSPFFFSASNNLSQLSKGVNQSDTQYIIDLKNELIDIMTTNKVASDAPFIIYNFKKLLSKISNTREGIKQREVDLKRDISQKLQGIIKDSGTGLGIDPTIKNLFEIFTVHVEIFLECIYEISLKAEGNTNRNNVLAKLVSNGNLDIKNSQTIFAWPEFRKENIHNGNALEESWLGKEQGILDNVDEVNFIEELLAALMRLAKGDEQSLATPSTNEVPWYPINPLDTQLFLTTNPYKSVNETSKFDDVFKLMLMRGFTYMGVTNKILSDDEIITMAKLEAINANSVLLDQKLKQATSQKDSNYIFTTFKKPIKTSGGFSTFLIESGTNYFYEYIDVKDKRKYIPISDSFDGKIFYNGDTLKGNSSLSDNTSIYVGNYNTNNIVDKPSDGSTYLKIISDSDYQFKSIKPGDVATNTIIAEGGIPLNVVSEDSLDSVDFINPDDTLSDFNTFGGSNGIQEFSRIKYTNGEADMYGFFYRNTIKPFLGTNLSSIPDDSDDLNLDWNNKNNKLDYFIVKTDSLALSQAISENYTYDNYGLNRDLIGNTSDVSVPFINFSVKDIGQFSLFGSHLYFAQNFTPTPNVTIQPDVTQKIQASRSKAFLFLHTFSWNGLYIIDNSFTPDQDKFRYRNYTQLLEQTILNIDPIRNLFAQRGGFIQTPKIWAAFIGGLLWRYKTTTIDADPLVFQLGGVSYVPSFDFNATTYPTHLEYLTGIVSSSSLEFTKSGLYKKVDQILLDLPEQAKNEFIRIFTEFADGNQWKNLREQLEVNQDNWNETNWQDVWKNIIGSIDVTENQDRYHNGKNYACVQRLKKSVITNSTLRNINNYRKIQPIKSSETDVCLNAKDSNIGDARFNYFLELRPDSDVNTNLVSLVNEKVYIANPTYRIWQKENSFSSNYNPILVTKDSMDKYVNAFITKFKELNKNETIQKDEDRIQQNLFNTMDDDTIKLNMYRTIKSIYDKWVAGSTNNNIMFQCGQRNAKDTVIANRAGRDKPSLIDSFRFVTRSFNDIGDKFFINPTVFTKIFTENYNQSFFDLISRVLADNNFDFIAMPSYIDYSNPDEIRTLFNRYDYKQGIDENISGPSFVCVYVGQTSNKLDLGNDAAHQNDGFDFRCDATGPAHIPDDYTTVNDGTLNNVAVFAVNYGHQNQSIFKDIILDQQEFTETAESLQITDAIAKAGSQNNQTPVGQNLYNVYQVRSYKAEVEMMGNAMIQPMMYFQLNSIPMFHGAYLITKVKHSIQPNYMSTVFSGVRIKDVTTPLITSETLYMSMLGALTDVNGKSSDGTVVKVGKAIVTPEISPYITYEIGANMINGLVLKDNKLVARYLIKENGELLERIATTYYNKTIKQKYGNDVVLTEASNYKNEPFLQGHVTHHNGTSVDIRAIRKDKTTGGVVFGDENYSLEGTKSLIQTIIDVGGSKIRHIYFNDPAILSFFGDNVEFAKGHSDHIHVEFTIPERVSNEIKNGNTSGEFNPNLVGTLQTIPSSDLPKPSYKLQSLGKI